MDYPRRRPGRSPFALVVNPVDPRATLIQVVGELDVTNVEQLFAAVERVPADHRTVVIALDECEFIDSIAIAAFLQVRARLEDADRMLFLCAPSPPVRRTLEIVGITGAGPVVDDLDSALSRKG